MLSGAARPDEIDMEQPCLFATSHLSMRTVSVSVRNEGKRCLILVTPNLERAVFKNGIRMKVSGETSCNEVLF